MNTLDILKQAINNRQPISFEYDKEGKIKGERIADPYILYLFTTKSTGKQNTKVDIVQTEGESDSKEKNPFPSFRSYLNIEDLVNVKILEDRGSFSPPFHEDYNPDSDRYKAGIIAKV